MECGEEGGQPKRGCSIVPTHTQHLAHTDLPLTGQFLRSGKRGNEEKMQKDGLIDALKANLTNLK